MQVSVEAGQGLERRMTVALPAERVEQEVQNRLQDLTRRAKVAGFRPGKVPLRVVQQKYGKQVRGEVVGELVKSSFSEAVKQEKLRPVTGPRIEPRSGVEGLEYVATFEVFPEFELATLDGLTVERPVAEVTAQDVDKLLQVLREQRITWHAVERAAREGDRLIIDYDGAVEGQEKKLEAHGVKVILGSRTLLPAFEQQLTGATAGQETSVDVTFPAEYPVESVSGRPVRFAVQVKSVEESHLPELDETFAQAFGVKQGGIEALRREVRANMELELEQAVRETVKRQVMGLLLTAHPIELPKALVEKESERARRQAPSARQRDDSHPEMFEGQARTRVALGLILGEFVKRHEIKPEAVRVRATVERIASTYEEPEPVARWIYSNREQLAEIESMVLEDQLVEWILERAHVREVPATFDAVMNRQPPGSPADSPIQTREVPS